MKPTSKTGTAMRQLQKSANTDGIAPPKKRRQLTAQPAPKPGNPFGGLNALVGKALKGGGGF